MILYPGFDAYPLCSECHGGQSRFVEPGAVALHKCINCNGTGHERERRPLSTDARGVMWIDDREHRAEGAR